MRWTGRWRRSLRDAFLEFESDESQKVAIPVGRGRHILCRCGFDRSLRPRPRARVASGRRRHRPDGAESVGVVQTVDRRRQWIPQWAGGLELSLLADLRICEEDSVFGVFCRRWGVPLIDGGTVRLPRIVGQGRALDMILTGRPVDAPEALAFGLANRVVPVGQSLQVAKELAHQLSAFPQLCMLADRASAYRSFDLPLAEALRAEGCRRKSHCHRRRCARRCCVRRGRRPARPIREQPEFERGN